eukprot:TRINITY_DN12260_c0_g1_i1.p1 TRINITY_DN12260_c0_g1~~TRINITY_DN12260_c0_g1_i1.p1  ORF type:complete len:146 (+),score=17.67 TRINITY_DN12260_c0_g1_i1:163-600(+)
MQRVDYYAVFGLDHTASYEQIKHRYMEYALILHPDKNKMEDTTAKFVLLQEAWKVLQDDEQRRQYNSDNNNFVEMPDLPVFAEVDLEDMKMEVKSDNTFYSYPCRCGDYFKISEIELENGIDLAPCTNCSYTLRIHYSIVSEEEL